MKTEKVYNIAFVIRCDDLELETNETHGYFRQGTTAIDGGIHLPGITQIARTAVATRFYYGQQCLLQRYLIADGSIVNQEYNNITNVALGTTYFKYPTQYEYTVNPTYGARIITNGFFWFLKYPFGAVNSDDITYHDLYGRRIYYPRNNLVNDVSMFGTNVNIDLHGNKASNFGGELTITNLAQFSKYVSDNGINISGRIFDIFLYDVPTRYGVSTTTPATHTLLGSFVCGEPSYDTLNYNIPFDDIYFTRNVNISKLINKVDNPNASDDIIGKAIPVHFGKFLDNYSYGIRTQDKIEKIEFSINNIIGTDGGDDLDLVVSSPIDADTKPVNVFVTGASFSSEVGKPSKQYEILVGNTSSLKKNGVMLTSGIYDVSDYFDNCYLHTIDGQESGEYRKIDSVVVDCDSRGGFGFLKTSLTSYYKDGLAGDSVHFGTAENVSWNEIVKVNREYTFDTWPLKGFVDENGLSISRNMMAYVYNSENIGDIELSGNAETKRIRSYGLIPQYNNIGDNVFTIKNYVNNNKIDIDLNAYTSDFDTIKNYSVLPATNVKNSDTPLSNMKAYYGLSANYTKENGDGLYGGSATYSWKNLPPYSDSGDALSTAAVDKLQSTVFSRSITPTALNPFSYAINFKLPAVPDDFKFNACFFVLKVDFRTTYTRVSDFTVNARIDFRKDWGSRTTVQLHTGSIQSGVNKGQLYLYSYPTRYLTDYDFTYTEGDYYLYTKPHDINFTGAGLYLFDRILCGKELYEMTGITSLEQYNAIRDCMLIFDIDTFDNVPTIDINVTEIGIAFEHNTTIKDAIYSKLYGRIYNSTWGSRKTSTALIENPIDILEHVCRLQNYNMYTYDSDQENYGQAYSDKAAIKTTGNGSFDDTEYELSNIKSLNTSFTLTEYDRMFSEEIKREICRQFSLISYIDSEGNECVKSSLEPTTASTKTFDLTNVYRDSIKIQERQVNDTYCEPVIRYKYNNGSQKFDGLITVTNTFKETFNSSYVTGVTSSYEAQLIWDACRLLYKKCGKINKISDNLSNFSFVQTEANAITCLKNFIKMQFTKKVSFDAHFVDIFGLAIGDCIQVDFSAHVFGLSKTGKVTSIKYNVMDYRCEVEATLYDDSGIADTYEEVLLAVVGVNDYEEVLTDIVGDNSITESI